MPGGNVVSKMVVFTDGRITGPTEACLKRAEEVSARGFGIDALGFGPEFDYKFMQKLVSYSGGYTEKIERPEEIRQVFARRVKDVTEAIATNVHLDLTFTPQVRAKRGYRYSPEIAYMGKIRLPDEDRTISIPIGSMERDKEVAYVVTLTVPKRPEGNVRVIKATLHYDIPALGVKKGASTQSVVVGYTHDAQRTNELRGEAERAL